ncbi:ABC transporter ATP-binding protein [Microbacterium sp. AZCO]|uniref:ABC transporter ATP-binding protein n=1 Tax=Microbacterium sp. AZCO TaxID=3142976 RepID=UPI0031F3C2C9
MTLLDIQGLTLDLPDGTELLRGISLSVSAGETVGLVGESGSGKSLTARSVLGLLPDRARTTGSVRVDGLEVLGASRRDLLEVRRRRAAMIFQDPRAGINPMRTIGDHMTESLRLCQGVSRAAAKDRALELLAAVRLPRPDDHFDQYPHELSGGMLQRVMIAGALTSDPKLLVCDEPTTALDVTTQADIVALLQELRDARAMGLLFITHDLNLAASLCDRLVVMRAGAVEEEGPARTVLLAPQTAYAERLVAATPSLTAPLAEPPGAVDAGSLAAAEPMLTVRGLGKTYASRGKEPVVAVRDASLEVPAGGSLAIVGESGSGKSTLARMIVGLEQADAGDIRIAGRERTTVPRTRAERRAHARSVQMVFQDPYLSLDPRITAGRAIEDALRLHGRASAKDARARVLELLAAVGLEEKHAAARPRTLSGGQRQRVAIARALAIEPDVLVMDEATSALDVSVQAQVLDLVARIRAERGLTLVFISHDLAVVRRVCDRTLVMSRGEIVEQGRTSELLADPQHPYTRRLLASVPEPLHR